MSWEGKVVCWDSGLNPGGGGGGVLPYISYIGMSLCEGLYGQFKRFSLLAWGRNQRVFV